MSDLQPEVAAAGEGVAGTGQAGDGVRRVNTEAPVLRNRKRKASTPVKGSFHV